jgi:hypothetical protein
MSCNYLWVIFRGFIFIFIFLHFQLCLCFLSGLLSDYLIHKLIAVSPPYPWFCLHEFNQPLMHNVKSCCIYTENVLTFKIVIILFKSAV